MLVRREFNRCLSISNTTLGPSGHGMKLPSWRLGTLFSHWRQWFMTKIHVLRLVSFVQRQSKHCVLIWNITLGPSGHGTKPPSSRLGTLYSRYRQCFMTTRQIWGIWKLRPAYSPETPNLGQNRWCFVPCDLEIWRMTLENNRASILCCFKLCATFHSHQWIQNGVTVRKRPIWVKFDDF